MWFQTILEGIVVEEGVDDVICDWGFVCRNPVIIIRFSFNILLLHVSSSSDTDEMHAVTVLRVIPSDLPVNNEMFRWSFHLNYEVIYS